MDINDRDLLAKTLQAEAGNQGLAGMLAAGSVIMNRTQTPGYGSGLRGVILKPGQFSAWNSLTGYAGGEQGQDMLNMRPSSAAYQAADKLLTGDYQDQTGGATHYYNPSISNPKWGQKRAGGDWQRIGDHIFGFADAGRGKRSPQATVSTKGTAPMMQQEEETPRGFLGGLGVQKMQEGASGETGQRFYNRDSFKDTAALLAQGFGRMGIMGMEEIADDIAKQRTEAKAKNKTLEYLSKLPNGDQLVELAQAVGPKAVAEFVMKQQLSGGSADPAEIRTLKYRAEAAGLTPGTPEFQKFMLTGGSSEEGSGPAAYEALRLRARDAKLTPGTPEYQQFMLTGGTGPTVAEQAESEEAKRLNQEQEDLAFFAAGERVLDRMQEPGMVATTGVLADYVKDTPFGQRQLDVAEDLEMMEAQMQFKTLANLKASSPNGSSGLGQLTEAERKALGKLYANFSNRQSEEAVARTIKSSLLLRAYFKNGLFDPTTDTPGYRNATPDELDQMLQGVNPFEGSGGAQLKGVKSFNKAPPANNNGAQKTKTGVTYKVIGDSN